MNAKSPEVAAAYARAQAILDDAVAAGLMTFDGRGYESIGAEGCKAWNQHVAARRFAEHLILAEGRESGRRYWAARGIEVGAKIYVEGSNWVTGARVREYGTAKVGAAGAYVTMPGKRRQLDPGQFRA